MGRFFQSTEQLEWLSFTLKTIYIVIYGGITYQLISVAQEKISESKNKKNQ